MLGKLSLAQDVMIFCAIWSCMTYFPVFLSYTNELIEFALLILGYIIYVFVEGVIQIVIAIADTPLGDALKTNTVVTKKRMVFLSCLY